MIYMHVKDKVVHTFNVTPHPTESVNYWIKASHSEGKGNIFVAIELNK